MKLDFVLLACKKNCLKLLIVNIVIIVLKNSISILKSHCFFLGNCIGKRNRKNFILFLTFGLFRGIFGIIFSIKSFLLLIS